MLPDGSAVTVPGVLDLVGGYETRDGWLLDGFDHGPQRFSLWLVTPDHAVHNLVSGAGGRGVAVAPDGRRFAWMAGGQMMVGRLAADKTLVIEHTVPSPERGLVFAYTGFEVILGAGCCSGIVLFDVWIPGHGAYVPFVGCHRARGGHVRRAPRDRPPDRDRQRSEGWQRHVSGRTRPARQPPRGRDPRAAWSDCFLMTAGSRPTGAGWRSRPPEQSISSTSRRGVPAAEDRPAVGRRLSRQLARRVHRGGPDSLRSPGQVPR